MALPEVKPIQPKARDQPFNDPRWRFELKYDGFRGVLHIHRNGKPLFSSRYGRWLGKFQRLAEQVAAEFAVDEAIFDGEVIAPDESGRPIFRNLMVGTPQK